MAGFNNEVVYGSNVDFSGAAHASPTITTNGQLLIGSTTLNVGGTHINVGTLTSPDGSVTIGYSSPNITLKSSGGISGPGSSTVGDIVLWNNTTGSLVSDAGFGFPLGPTHGGTGQTSYTTGDILYASASNILSKLSLPTIPGVDLHYNGTNVTYFNPLQEARMYEDFYGTGVNIGTYAWRTGSTGGAGAAVSPNPGVDSAHPGTVQLITGTSAAGTAYIQMGSNGTGNPLIVGGGAITFIWVIKLSNLSDGTNTYQVNIGLTDRTNASAPFYGIYFFYNDTGALPNWYRVTNNAGSITQTDTTVAANTNWTTLRVDINAAATSITYYINGVNVGSNVANIPTNSLSPYLNIIQSAGASSRSLTSDLFYFYQNLTAAR
jgi:hypothetical protein